MILNKKINSFFNINLFSPAVGRTELGPATQQLLVAPLAKATTFVDHKIVCEMVEINSIETINELLEQGNKIKKELDSQINLIKN